MSNQSVILVIPARLQSTRLPGKVLADIHGHPMLWHVYSRAKMAKIPSEVLIATDSEEVARRVADWGGRAIMTSPDCTCGTERIASIVDQLDAEIIINVQGDEPMIDPGLIDELGRRGRSSGADMVTPVVKISATDVLMSPNTVKVAIRQDGRALYFSRSPIPYLRDANPETWMESSVHWLHIGAYAFRRQALMDYMTWPQGELEGLEKIEPLRFLEEGKTIQTFETTSHSVAVDTPEDLDKVRHIMAGESARGFR